MTPQTAIMDIPEEAFRQQVYSIISRELGLGGYARFLMTFCSGKGDYTAERQRWADELTVDEVWKQMEEQGLLTEATGENSKTSLT